MLVMWSSVMIMIWLQFEVMTRIFGLTMSCQGMADKLTPFVMTLHRFLHVEGVFGAKVAKNFLMRRVLTFIRSGTTIQKIAYLQGERLNRVMTPLATKLFENEWIRCTSCHLICQSGGEA
jgi:hypothetical protein